MVQAARRHEAANEAPVRARDDVAASALRAVEPSPPSPFQPLDAAGVHARLSRLRMSPIERETAVDALRLGRDIGNALFRLHLIFMRRRSASPSGRDRRQASGRTPGKPVDPDADEWRTY